MNWIVVALLLIIAVNVLAFLILSFVLYAVLLIRGNSKKWGHEVSLPDDPEYVAMYKDGLAWGEKYLEFRKDLSTENDEYKLFAHYFDFGFDRAVIIIPGRMECCKYSYYFAEPYRASGYNVLTIDARAHGYSEGKISALGQKEYSDVLAWGKLLHDSLGIKAVVLHGVCIGASTAIFAMTAKNCPDYMRAMVADGMYVTFAESFKNHMYEKNRPIFPFYYLVMLYIRLFSGVKAVKDGPLYRIDKLKKPILFIHSRKDIYSLPERAEELFEKCGSDKKEIEWFDKGGHSRIRFTNTEKYDTVVSRFISDF